LSLKESCTLFDRYCRRNSDTPTFEEFNKVNFTCLPNDNMVYDQYSRVLIAARRATGVPVTRRLPSLFKKLSVSTESSPVEVTPHVQIRPQTNSFKSSVPNLDSTMRMSIRPPACIPIPAIIPTIPAKVVKISATVPAKVATIPVNVMLQTTWTRAAYAEAVKANPSILLKESTGHMVHLVPPGPGDSFERLACKLTKSIWESLRGKSTEPLKMRDGSFIDMSTLSLNEGDLAEFVQNHKERLAGPHFIRFSRI